MCGDALNSWCCCTELWSVGRPMGETAWMSHAKPHRFSLTYYIENNLAIGGTLTPLCSENAVHTLDCAGISHHTLIINTQPHIFHHSVIPSAVLRNSSDSQIMIVLLERCRFKVRYFGGARIMNKARERKSSFNYYIPWLTRLIVCVKHHKPIFTCQGFSSSSVYLKSRSIFAMLMRYESDAK